MGSIDRDFFIEWIAQKRKNFLSNFDSVTDPNLKNFIAGQLSGLRYAEDILLETRCSSCSIKEVADMLEAQAQRMGKR